MKKKMKTIMTIIVVIYGIETALFFGWSYINKKEIIQAQEQLIKEETDRVAELTAEVESARQDIEQLKAYEGRIRETEPKVEELGRRNEELRGRIEELRAIEEDKQLRASRGGGVVITVKVTGYCSCSYCCGEWAYKNPGKTASGTYAKYGTIAAPSSLPFGTQMKIQGYGDQIFTVEDTGSAVVESNGVYVIDMWMPTHAEAYAVGNRIVEATILN